MLDAYDWMAMADRRERDAAAHLQMGNVYEAGVQYQLGLDALTRGLPTLLAERESVRIRYEECMASLRERTRAAHWALMTMAEFFVAAPTFAHLGIDGKRLLLGDWLPVWQR